MMTIAVTSYHLKRVDCSKMTVHTDLIPSIKDERTKKVLEKRFKEFEEARENLRGNGNMQILQKLNSDLSEMTLIHRNSNLDNVIIMGESSIVKQVLYTLVDMHNKFLDDVLHLCAKYQSTATSFFNKSQHCAAVQCKSLTEVGHREIISFQWTDDVLKHSQCMTEYGEGRLIT